MVMYICGIETQAHFWRTWPDMVLGASMRWRGIPPMDACLRHALMTTPFGYGRPRPQQYLHTVMDPPYTLPIATTTMTGARKGKVRAEKDGLGNERTATMGLRRRHCKLYCIASLATSHIFHTLSCLHCRIISSIPFLHSSPAFRAFPIARPNFTDNCYLRNFSFPDIKHVYRMSQYNAIPGLRVVHTNCRGFEFFVPRTRNPRRVFSHCPTRSRA